MDNNITYGNPGSFSYDDPWLPVARNVTLNQALCDSITAVRPYYAKHQHKGLITSGYRSPEYQLALIIGFTKDHGVYSSFPELVAGGAIDMMLNGHYWWQPAWSKLLEIGMVVNPPIAAKCLCHSLRPDGSDRIGAVIPASTHSLGTAYDQDGGVDHDPSNELVIMKECQADPACKIKSLVIERMQSCVHADILV